MEARPSFVNAKLLVDVFPFKNKHWRITAGLYFGGRTVAKAVNTLADTQTLIGVRMYAIFVNIQSNEFKSEGLR